MNNSLLPPGSSALERKLAQACSGISDLNVPLRDLWNPWKCPVKFLPYLAWAFSVDRWEESWSEEEKRREVSEAFWSHQRKGTVAAIRRVVERLGYSMSIEEWWQVADPAGTFRMDIDLNDVGITETMVRELERLIGDAKPASRHIAQLTLAARTQGAAFTGAAVFDGDEVSVYPPEYEPDSGIFYNGVFPYEGDVDFIGE
ncbi:TPA: phage tail protein I [Klebsiella pneumoniae]|uniref:phage tail protein I n=3 Tax=Klebsiella TaxID=570 RepID=UPI000E2A929D|nr:phage tail protein I [Klebsiella pneumoniae]EKQ1215640.1 phage tail protein I [Klebsiella pneumoniae]EKV4910762.1 phage tail protein I [Klebsiella pneumoniae]ELA2665799.1 phage tail protein I [Klebsiella pneumoniae]MBC4479241.1 phage tail protein I [Klebsiella pneumoniae]MCP6768320.1 phage tail protein I [Klebsiella pneumoniae]